MNTFAYIAPWVFASLGFGMATGYFLRPRETKEPESDPARPDSQAILKVLTEVLNAAERMSADAKTHDSKIQETARHVEDLQVSGELDSVKHVLLGHMRTMLKSNENLQDDLAYSRCQVEEQAVQIDAVRQEARIDALTGIANRKGFDEKLRLLLAAWQRERQPLVIMMIDLDHFKRINDSHGHQAGDRVLEEVGSWLKKWLRDGDYAARFGGDEFAILLPKTELAEGVELAEEIWARTGDNTHRVAVRDAKVSVALSIGVAAPCEGDTAETLLHRADQALYRAKDLGRNRVQVN